MPCFRRNWQPVSSKGDLPLIRIFNLKHKSRFVDAPQDDLSFILRQLFTGLYGVLQGVCKADGKLGRIDGERFGDGKMEFYGNAGIFGLAQISSERSI